MTGDHDEQGRDAGLAVALNYAGAARPALEALFALDATLGRIVRSTTQPLVGQMRLTWWHEALAALDTDRPAPAEPVLRALARDVVTRGVTGAEMAAMIEGWEPLLDAPPLTDAISEAHGEFRGALLFAMAARLLGGRSDPAAGTGWALADLAAHWSQAAEADRTREAASVALRRWRQRMPRTLTVLASLAQDLGGRPRRAPLSRWAMLRAVLR